MNWRYLRSVPWLDTRARFVASLPLAGNLLDLGSSDGQTLRHFAELRPDVHLFAVDRAGEPDRYPARCQFHRADLERDRLPWAAASMDAITCMHLVEHLRDLALLFQETARLLKPGACVYFETPHPKTVLYSSPPDTAAGTFTLNFYDDVEHQKPVSIGALGLQARQFGLEPVKTGASRNWLFALAYLLYFFGQPSARKHTAWAHCRGWSAYLIARKPPRHQPQ